MIPLIDGHLDLVWNAIGFERDLTLSIDEINIGEEGCQDHAARGEGVVSLAEMHRGGVVLCHAAVAREARSATPDGRGTPHRDKVKNNGDVWNEGNL